MLYMRRCDQPGLLGRFGALPGNIGLIIATPKFGRSASGGEPMVHFAIDVAIDNVATDAVRGLSQVVRTKCP